MYGCEKTPKNLTTMAQIIGILPVLFYSVFFCELLFHQIEKKIALAKFHLMDRLPPLNLSLGAYFYLNFYLDLDLYLDLESNINLNMSRTSDFKLGSPVEFEKIALTTL